MNINDIKYKIAEIRKRDLGDLSLKAVEDWEQQIRDYEQILSLHDIPQFKALLDDYQAIINNINDILAEQEVISDEDIRKRQQLISDKRVYGEFIKRFSKKDLTEVEKEIDNNYKHFYEEPTKIKE